MRIADGAGAARVVPVRVGREVHWAVVLCWLALGAVGSLLRWLRLGEAVGREAL